MMQLSEAARVLHARQITGDGDVRFFAVSTDTRGLQPGDLYVALRGEHFDGADFIAQAMQGGAVAALVNQDSGFRIQGFQFYWYPILVSHWGNWQLTGVISLTFRWLRSPAATAKPQSRK